MANHQLGPRSCSICHEAKSRISGQYFCRSHDKCQSCRTVGHYNAIVDGRKICPECLSTATMDMKECRRILKSTFKFFQKIGLKLKMEDAHAFLVDKDEMQRITGWESCLPTCINDCLRDTQPAQGLFVGTKSVNCVTKCSQAGNKFEVSKKTMRVPGAGMWLCVPREGKAILIHYGRARIRTQATMAHEMMHLCIWKQGLVCPLSKKVEEGLCHLISHMWLEQYVAENPFTQKLKERLMRENENNADKDRRDGFLEANKPLTSTA